MANKWFSSIFLPSVFRSCGTGRSRWLTRRQTAVCTDNMERQAVRVDLDHIGDRHGMHLSYFCEWEGRRVSLSYSKKNGCGYITFGASPEELEEAEKRRQQERARIEAERLARIKRNPERLAWYAARLKRELDSACVGYEFAQEDGDQNSAEHWARCIVEIKAQMEQLGVGEA